MGQSGKTKEMDMLNGCFPYYLACNGIQARSDVFIYVHHMKREEKRMGQQSL